MKPKTPPQHPAFINPDTPLISSSDPQETAHLNATCSRRTWLQGLGQSALAATLVGPALLGATDADAANKPLLQRPIPGTKESLPVIGLGTWQTFDITMTPKAAQQRLQVLQALQQAGGTVIDSSPMYGRSEAVVGALCQKLGGSTKFFFATKVWTTGKQAGIQQMKASLRKMKTQRMDLMQIHNLVDWKTHLETLKAWKAQGKIRYIGITHYVTSAFDDLAQIMKSHPIDFVQLPYSVVLRDAEKRLLPLAQDRKIGVLVNRPYEGGALFRQVKGRPVPTWLQRDLQCATWAQVFLKFLLSHPTITCVIPGTSKVKHMRDNLQAGTGRLPNKAQREKIARLF